MHRSSSREGSGDEVCRCVDFVYDVELCMCVIVCIGLTGGSAGIISFIPGFVREGGRRRKVAYKGQGLEGKEE